KLEHKTALFLKSETDYIPSKMSRTQGHMLSP
nr:hypothetical protein [Tanacetum cinerariifolium]